MTRRETLNKFEIDENYRILSERKFRYQNIYIPHMYETWLNGARYMEGDFCIVPVTKKDVQEFPELDQTKNVVFIIDKNDCVHECE